MIKMLNRFNTLLYSADILFPFRCTKYDYTKLTMSDLSLLFVNYCKFCRLITDNNNCK